MDFLDTLGQPDPEDVTYVPVSKQQIVRAKDLIKIWETKLSDVTPCISPCEDAVSNDIVVYAPGASCRIEPEYTSINLYTKEAGRFAVHKHLRYRILNEGARHMEGEMYLFNQIVDHLEKRARSEKFYESETFSL